MSAREYVSVVNEKQSTFDLETKANSVHDFLS